jgi:hypothetical protein
MTRQQFVRKFWPLAHALGSEYDISPVGMIAHALKESGAGNERAAARHNYFGFLRGGKFLVFPDDVAGWTAYAKRMVAAFPAVVAVSEHAGDFARAVAYSKNPTYVDEAPPKKVVYEKTLRAIHRAVAQDVARMHLRDQVPIAGIGGGMVEFLTTKGRKGPALSKKGDGEACIKNITALDRDTHRRIIRIQTVQAQLKARGKTNPIRDGEVARIVAGYNGRQKRLRESSQLKVQTRLSADVRAMMETLKSWWAKVPGVGALPLVVIVPAALVALSVASYLVYNAWFRDEVQAQKDNDAAAHSDEIYQGMSPAEQKFDDDRSAASYKTGFTAGQQDGGIFSGLQGPALLIGGVLLFNAIRGQRARN